MPNSTTAHRKLSFWRKPAIWFTLTACASLGGCVSPPTLVEVRNFGFETPVQSFQSFVTALRAKWPDQEYLCFSSRFKDRFQLSDMAYREFRDAMLKEQPLLRWALARATKDPKKYRISWADGGRMARIQVDIHGHELNVHLLREDYFESRGKPEDPLAPSTLWEDGNVADLASEYYLMESEDKEFLFARIPNPKHNLEDLVFMKVGREWKIDDIYVQQERDTQP